MVQLANGRQAPHWKGLLMPTKNTKPRDEEEPFLWTEAVLGICLWTLLLSVLYGMFFL